MSEAGPDSIPLGKDRLPAAQKAEAKREQDIRLECLKAAVTGSSSGHSAQQVVSRAKAFEDYILYGTEPARSEPQVFSPKQDGGWLS